RLRIFLTGLVFFLLLGVVLVRAAYLQVVQRDKLHGLAEDQYVRELEIPAKRGDIYDRRGTPLAQSVEVDSIWVDPTALSDAHQAARELSRKLKLDGDDLEARMAR